jgi:hypothetical protein
MMHSSVTQPRHEVRQPQHHERAIMPIPGPV